MKRMVEFLLVLIIVVCCIYALLTWRSHTIPVNPF